MSGLIVLTLYELLVISITVLATATVLDILNRVAGRLILRAFGSTVYLAATAPSTVLHELSHAIMCLIFLHRIERMEIFSLDPATGRLGYVRHSWDTGSLYEKAGNFWIGIAPMVAGVPLLFLAGATCGIRTDFARGLRVALSGGATHWTGPAVARYVIAPLLSGFAGVFTMDNFVNPYFYLYLPAAFVLSRAMAPSLLDLKGSGMGVTALVVLIFAVNVVAAFFGHDPRSFAATVVAAFSTVLQIVGSAIAVTLFFLAILWALGLAVRRK